MTKPQGREAVKEALIEAGIKLFAQRGIKAVTIRDIASEANVNSALIYRHFKNKDGLVKATVDALYAYMIPDGTQADQEIADASLLLQSFMSIREHPEVFQIFAHLSLEQEPGSFKGLDNDYFEAMIEKIRQAQEAGRIYADVEPRVLLACSYAMGLGWHVFKPLLLAISGLNQKDHWIQPQQVTDFWFDLINNADSNTEPKP